MHGWTKAGYGRLAVAESALAENKLRTWIIRDVGQPRLAIAAPAKAGIASSAWSMCSCRPVS